MSTNTYQPVIDVIQNDFDPENFIAAMREEAVTNFLRAYDRWTHDLRLERRRQLPFRQRCRLRALGYAP